MSASGLELSTAAAPVLSGGADPVPEGFMDGDAVLEMVAVVMVEFMPGVGMAETDAATELMLDLMLAMADEADAAALVAADEADAMAEDSEPEPPLRLNWRE
jgi:hypothetical protein